jgi:hypothetical protein
MVVSSIYSSVQFGKFKINCYRGHYSVPVKLNRLAPLSNADRGFGSRVGSCGDGIEDVETLSAWECGSHLYGPQKFEVYLYPTRSKYEVKEMARTNQGL